MSSSRLGEVGTASGNAELLIDTPSDVRFERAEVEGGTRVVVGHNGYQTSHGLTHARTFHLGFEGRALRGEDVLMAMSTDDRRRYDSAFSASNLQGVDYTIRFHLHPDVDVTLDMNGTAVSMALKSGEIWVFRVEGDVETSLESSVYLEKSRLSPRATKQIVLPGRAIEYSPRIIWSLAMPQATPSAVRDDEVEDLQMPVE